VSYPFDILEKRIFFVTVLLMASVCMTLLAAFFVPLPLNVYFMGYLLQLVVSCGSGRKVLEEALAELIFFPVMAFIVHLVALLLLKAMSLRLRGEPAVLWAFALIIRWALLC
jgi:hypothetical protein